MTANLCIFEKTKATKNNSMVKKKMMLMLMM